jgi:predicted membrane-bound mannosyltransferase
LGGDESVYAGQAGILAHEPGMNRWFIPASRGNSNFLLAQWITSLVYRVFGMSDISARMVSVVASVLTVALVFLIARQFYTRAEALASALVLAISGYAILLGRLALLDAAACFFLTLAMYSYVKWSRTDRFVWMASFVVAAALALEVKVTSVLVVPIVVILLAMTGEWRRLLRLRTLAVLPIAVLALLPAVLQLLANTGGLRNYFAASTARTSGVPWYYYFGVLASAEGAVMSVAFVFGVVLALLRRRRTDLMLLVWVATYAVFLQFYPLKGFNYALPILPPLAILTGRAVVWLGFRGLSPILARVREGWGARPLASLAVVALVLVGSHAFAVEGAVANDRSAGMREAAYWLRAHGDQRAGVMTLSHGSAQYVLSFYGGIDSYPYGRFRIATVIPGGIVVRTTARPGGKVPLDWVDYWPTRLIEQGRVSYLVYQTRPLDDPPEQSQVAGTITERQFRSFIATFGGELVHTVYWHHEARVYIYRVTRRLKRPVVAVTDIGSFTGRGRPATTIVRASGFAIGSLLTMRYHGVVVGRTRANKQGSATLPVKLPTTAQWQYHLVVSDQQNDTASVTGVSSTRLVYTVRGGEVHVFGDGYEPGGAVVVSYQNRRVGTTRASVTGSVNFSFRLPVHTHPRFRITAVDQFGRLASATGLPTPKLVFVATAGTAEITGRSYFPGSRIDITYGGRPVGTARTDAIGRFRFKLSLPSWARSSYRLIATDSIGRSTWVIGLVPK